MPRKRQPKPRAPKSQKYTLKDFEREFSSDDVCLEWLKNYLYPDGIFCETCQKVTKHHKVASRRSYSCDYCGHHVHPTADTIYHKSPTPLRLWFYAIYLMASTRCGISAKQLERELGVTYKTAWRMFKQIRSMLAEDCDPLTGKVEVDETYIGGKAKNMHKSRREKIIQGRGAVGKVPVVGAVQREGRVIAKTADCVNADTLIPFVKEHVMPESTVFTDEHRGYGDVESSGYSHKRVHHTAKVYVIGDAHTNTIEGFWSLVKRGIGGVYHNVSAKYLQSYFDEYSFRYNRRLDSQPMFHHFLTQVEKKSCD
jgi:transposase-like protein